jgi:hypothetical protein
MELPKFRPRWAMEVLASQAEKDEIFVQTWALAQLLAWSFLDQEPGKRRPKGIPARKRLIHVGSAKQAGHITLAHLLDRRLKHLDDDDPKNTDGKLDLMLGLFLKSGGFSACFKSWGENDIFYAVKEANRELEYVFRIVDYMCRYQKYYGDEKNFSIESAKYFVRKNEHEDEQTYKPSKISKIWEKYKNSSPYIFSVYRYCRLQIDQAKTMDQVIDWLEAFSHDQRRLLLLVGRAAYAADVLAGKGRNVRERDFKNIKRFAPHIRPFAADERSIIESIDPQAPLA